MTEQTSIQTTGAARHLAPTDLMVGTASRTLTASEIMHLRGPIHEWRCPERGCNHALHFALDHIDAIPLQIVRHMLEDHGMTCAAIGEKEPHLCHLAEVHCVRMGLPG